MSVVPYKDTQDPKKAQVAEMFNSISPKYDLLNHVLSLGIDIIWRKKAVRQLQKDAPKLILDIATGTGDFAIEALALNPDKVIGVDISEGMLSEGRKKMIKRGSLKTINAMQSSFLLELETVKIWKKGLQTCTAC